ncbi:MAG: polysaccharide deacetylase family protein [Bacteroidota bacterium]
MQIRIVLDCEESFKKKAAYTLETFCQVLGLPHRLSRANEVSPTDIVIWYGPTESSLSARVVFIQASAEAPRLFLERRGLDVSKARRFVLFGEDSVALFFDEKFARDSTEIVSGDDRCRQIHVDIVASAFYFLSCWQEITSTECDRHERFPATASLQYGLGLLETPVVNQYVEILRREIEKLLGHQIEQRPRFGGKEFAICMTHDIDYIRKWTLGILYRELVQYFLLGREDGGLGKRFERLKAFQRAVSTRNDPFTWSLEKILTVERDLGVHATYFLKTGVTSRHDVSYRIKDGYVRKLLKTLEFDGHEIGLHPSYHTFLSTAKMRGEKERLDEVLGRKSNAVRQHFLRLRIPETWKIQAELNFQHDSTLGFPDHEGFRAGICHPFRPYDASQDVVVDLWEIPLLAMDGTFQSYRNKSAGESLDIIRSLIKAVKRYCGVAVLLFHNTCYDNLDFPDWGKVFEDTLHFALGEGAFVGSAEEILTSYLESLNRPIRQ